MEMGRVKAGQSLRILETAAVTSVILGRELRRARNNRKLTQETLAERPV